MILVEKPEEKGHLEDLCIDGRVILKRILKKLDEQAWTGFIWLGRGTGRRLL
jgi:hypothetical protein